MKIEIVGILKFILECFIIFKVDYGWPSEKTARYELTLFRSLYFEWKMPTKYWD